MFKQSENIAHRLFNRQIFRSRPNTHIHQARKFYQNIVPSHTIYDVNCPDHSFRKFTNDGQYLISFSRNYQDLIVYRLNWLNFCVEGEERDHLFHLPSKSKEFDSYFSQLYTLPLASGSESICKDFFLSTENGLYGIFATSTVPENPTTPVDGAISGVPSAEKITISLVSLAEGHITDQRVFENDFIHLAHNMGMFLYDDLLAILSIRFQCIRLLQIRETGKFVDVRTIGAHCREDDELILNSQAQDEELYQKKQAAVREARGLSLDVSVSKNGINSQENAWPQSWNMKWPNLSRELDQDTSHNTRSAPNPLSDPSSGGTHCPDFHLQYEDHFSNLFATWEGTALRDTNGLDSGDFGRLGINLQDRRGLLDRSPLVRNGHAPSIEFRISALPGDSYTGQNPDGSTSGVHCSSSRPGPSQFERSYSSTSGDNADRSSGRDTTSTPYTSTTITSTDSGSQSESSRLDTGLSGGSTSYDRAMSVQLPFPDDVSLPRSSHYTTDHREPMGRILMDNEQSFDNNLGVGNRHTFQHLRAAEELTAMYDPSSVRRSWTDVAPRQARRLRTGENGLGNGLQRNRAAMDAPGSNADGGEVEGHFLCGLKQRLLSFLIQCVWDEDISPIMKAQRLKRFYYHFQHYIDLVMWKVQFLDRSHLLIKFGSVDGILQRNPDTSHQTSFLAVYNLETTEMLGFYSNSSEEFLLAFEQFCDHFRVAPRYPLYMNYISSWSNNSYARDQLHNQRGVKRAVAWLPFNAQCQSPSAYFDRSLFHYDDKLISAMDRHKLCNEHPIKFISRRRPNLLKFKINPGLEFDSNEARIKRVVSFIFHPSLPFAISIQQSLLQPPILNFHLRK